jgi:hypothetical protein
MQEMHQDELAAEERIAAGQTSALLAELAALKAEVKGLRETLDARR